MPITRTAWIDDDGTGTVGTIINNAEKTTLYNQIDALVGPWVAVTYNAANFGATGGGGSWTVSAGDHVAYAYAIHNKTMAVSVYLQDTAVAGTPSTLNIVLPAGITSAFQQYVSVQYWMTGTPAGTTLTAMGNCQPGSPYILISRDFFGSPWAAAAQLYLSINAAMAIA